MKRKNPNDSTAHNVKKLRAEVRLLAKAFRYALTDIKKLTGRVELLERKG